MSEHPPGYTPPDAAQNEEARFQQKLERREGMENTVEGILSFMRHDLIEQAYGPDYDLGSAKTKEGWDRKYQKERAMIEDAAAQLEAGDPAAAKDLLRQMAIGVDIYRDHVSRYAPPFKDANTGSIASIGAHILQGMYIKLRGMQNSLERMEKK